MKIFRGAKVYTQGQMRSLDVAVAGDRIAAMGRRAAWRAGGGLHRRVPAAGLHRPAHPWHRGLRAPSPPGRPMTPWARPTPATA